LWASKWRRTRGVEGVTHLLASKRGRKRTRGVPHLLRDDQRKSNKNKKKLHTFTPSRPWSLVSQRDEMISAFSSRWNNGRCEPVSIDEISSHRNKLMHTRRRDFSPPLSMWMGGKVVGGSWTVSTSLIQAALKKKIIGQHKCGRENPAHRVEKTACNCN